MRDAIGHHGIICPQCVQAWNVKRIATSNILVILTQGSGEDRGIRA